MPDTKKYRFTNNTRSIKTVGAFLQYQRSAVFGKYKNAKEFLDEKDEDGVDNYTRVLAAANTDVEVKAIRKQYSKRDFENIPIPYGIEFVCTKNKINVSNYAFQGVRLVPISEAYFKAKKLVELEKNKEYRKVDNVTDNNTAYGKLLQQLSQVSVWIWPRALDKPTKLFDCSPFLLSCDIGSTANGGNFTLKLPLIPYSRPLNELGGYDWAIDEAAVRFFNGTETFIDTSLLRTKENGEIGRNKFLFEDLVQPNDLVFIRFETLQFENNERPRDVGQLIVDSSELPGKVYDLIGLVDNNQIVINAEGTSASIEISGRDLVKLFIDDGTYFFPFEIAGGKEYFGSQGKNNELTNRVYSGNGALTSFDINKGEVSIVEVFQFVLQQLSNISLVPEQLLQSYPRSGIDKLAFQLKDNGTPNIDRKVTADDYNIKALNKGIFKLINIVTDENVDKRVVVDSSLSTATGSLLNFFQSVVQEEFFQLIFDTYGDQYYITIRKTPFDKSSYEALLKNVVKTRKDDGRKQSSLEYEEGRIIDIDDSEVINESLDWETEVYSWYHLSPKHNILGSQFNLNFLPAVFLEQYGEIWGSKPLMVQHSYLNFPTKETADSASTISNMETQGMVDLKFIVESTAYLPFTRRGVITVVGDRRLKRGNFIRYKPTGEIFYIDTVAQSFEINTSGMKRTTTLGVSRGMVEKFILDEKYSYFKLFKHNNPIKFVKKDQPVYETRTTVLNQKEIDAFVEKHNEEGFLSKEQFDKHSNLNPFLEKTFDSLFPNAPRLDIGSPFVNSISQAGVDFIKNKEGFVPTAYADGIDANGKQLYSIGYGYQLGPNDKDLLNRAIGRPEAERLLYKKINQAFVPQIRTKLLINGIQLNQNEFDAVTSYVYTTGTLHQHMIQKIKQYKQGKISESDIYSHWSRSAITEMGTGKIVNVQRRKEEAAMFLGKTVGELQANSAPEPLIESTQVQVGTKAVMVPDREDFFKNFIIDDEVLKFFLTRRQKI